MKAQMCHYAGGASIPPCRVLLGGEAWEGGINPGRSLMPFWKPTTYHLASSHPPVPQSLPALYQASLVWHNEVWFPVLALPLPSSETLNKSPPFLSFSFLILKWKKWNWTISKFLLTLISYATVHILKILSSMPQNSHWFIHWWLSVIC